MPAPTPKTLLAREQVRLLAGDQAAVVSRRQVLEAGPSDAWIARRLASKRWQRVHPGVYATITGPLPWRSRCWAAVLYAGDGAALADDAALRSLGMRTQPRENAPITVAVDHSRRVRSVEGVRVIRVRDLGRLLHPARQPPTLRLEAALLLKASRARRPDDAIGVLADACQQHLTTPARLRDQLAELPSNLPHRGVVVEILDDVAAGAYSYLEVHYLRDVERPHGLPTGRRQRRVSAGRRVWFRDVEYVGLRLVVELDGRLGHERFEDRSGDMDRDNRTAVGRRRSLRVGYRQTMSAACETAVAVIEILRQEGWRGTPRACGAECPVALLLESGETLPPRHGGQASPAA